MPEKEAQDTTPQDAPRDQGEQVEAQAPATPEAAAPDAPKEGGNQAAAALEALRKENEALKRQVGDFESLAEFINEPRVKAAISKELGGGGSTPQSQSPSIYDVDPDALVRAQGGDSTDAEMRKAIAALVKGEQERRALEAQRQQQVAGRRLAEMEVMAKYGATQEQAKTFVDQYMAKPQDMTGLLFKAWLSSNATPAADSPPAPRPEAQRKAERDAQRQNADAPAPAASAGINASAGSKGTFFTKREFMADRPR